MPSNTNTTQKIVTSTCNRSFRHLKKRYFFKGFGDRLPAESKDMSPRTVPCPCERPPGQPDVDRYRQIYTDMDR